MTTATADIVSRTSTQALSEMPRALARSSRVDAKYAA
jgi:hypothetical protein